MRGNHSGTYLGNDIKLHLERGSAPSNAFLAVILQKKEVRGDKQKFGLVESFN